MQDIINGVNGSRAEPELTDAAPATPAPTYPCLSHCMATSTANITYLPAAGRQREKTFQKAYSPVTLSMPSCPASISNQWKATMPEHELDHHAQGVHQARAARAHWSRGRIAAIKTCLNHLSFGARSGVGASANV